MSPQLDDAPAVAAWLSERLEDDGIDYAIGGALALAAFGLPRMTNDVDLSVYVPESEIDRLFDALERAGCLFERRQAREQIERASLFRVRCGSVGVDLFVAFHSHHHDSLKRRVRLPDAQGRLVWFISAEDYAVHKLALFRGKDRVDLELLFAARGAELDVSYIRRWIEAIAPEGDPRRAELEDLARRFAS